MLLQAVAERPPGGLSLGESLLILSGALSVGALLIKFGEMKADARNLKTKMEDELADVRQSVANALADLNRRMDEVLDFIHDSQQQSIKDARWQESTTAAINAAAREAADARSLVHLALKGGS